jgi:hypothetical protein
MGECNSSHRGRRFIEAHFPARGLIIHLSISNTANSAAKYLDDLLDVDKGLAGFGVVGKGVWVWACAYC